MDYKDVQCDLCKWWTRGEGNSEYGVCTESPPPAVVEVGTNDVAKKKRWKQPLVACHDKCSRFTHKDTGDEIDM